MQKNVKNKRWKFAYHPYFIIKNLYENFILYFKSIQN